jgi:hypothetical protein
MADRGVMYMVWGNSENVERALDRSRRSLAAVHPELPVEIFRMEASNATQGLLEKARMLQLTPFRETLFLDADTVVIDRLDFGFRQAAKFGLACCICESPWARRYPVLDGDIVEYNTGVMFFTELARPVFDAWSRLAQQVDSTLIFVVNGKQDKMSHNDQCSFAMAIDETGFSPYVLPLNWNFRPHVQRSFYGPIKIWHAYADVPPVFYELKKYYGQKDAIIQYHAAGP